MKQPELGAHIAKLRIQTKQTQKDLADLTKVDIRTIQRIEAGEVMPRMHTIKLLSAALSRELNVEYNCVQSSTEEYTKQIRLSFLIGMVFSINYILFVINTVFWHFNPLIRIPVMLIHIAGIIFFVRGFYLIARQNSNQLLKITSMVGMVLLPLLGVLSMLESQPVFNPMHSFLIYSIVCFNAIGNGIGMFLEGYQKLGFKYNLYRIAGIVTVLQSLFLLNVDSKMIYTGLVISAICNFIGVMIFKAESGELQSPTTKNTGEPILA